MGWLLMVCYYLCDRYGTKDALMHIDYEGQRIIVDHLEEVLGTKTELKGHKGINTGLIFVVVASFPYFPSSQSTFLTRFPSFIFVTFDDVRGL